MDDSRHEGSSRPLVPRGHLPAAIRTAEKRTTGLRRTVMTPTQAPGEPMRRLALFLIAVLSLTAAPAFGAPDDTQDNAPWYQSLQAEFFGSYDGRNTVAEVRSRELAYPSGYNMSHLNENEIFIQGGSYGNLIGSIGPFVAKVNPQTLEHVWFTLPRNAKAAGVWNYPGAMP